MDYSFEPFIGNLSDNWFDDDPLLRRLLDHYLGSGAYDSAGLSRWGAEVAGPLRELAEGSARADGLPRIEQHDAYGRRVDRILLPDATREALAKVHGREGLGAPHGNPFVFYAKGYLYGQNGESGVVCSLGCTDGMVRALEALGDGEPCREAVQRIRNSSPERIWHGAQFVTEIQGGSDVPANRVEARRDDGEWRLHGRKWFCSNVNADYFLVTARPEGAPEGAEGVGLFLVPSHLDPEAPPRNGHTVDRLKEKLGTRELATAEVTFQGALAWPVGPLDRGLSNLVRHVLTTSRFYCVQSTASTLRQALRVATTYADFRTAFGRPLREFPLVDERLLRIRQASRRALAAYMELLRLWQLARGAGGRHEPDGKGGQAGLELSDGTSVERDSVGGDPVDSDPVEGDSAEEDPVAAMDFRILLSLCKPVLTMTSTRMTHEAMLLLGGNGIEERFSLLPRLYRDAVIMEIWEGPHDVLFTQALKDLRRFDVNPQAFVHRVLGAGSSKGEDAEDAAAPAGSGARALAQELAHELGKILSGAAHQERRAEETGPASHETGPAVERTDPAAEGGRAAERTDPVAEDGPGDDVGPAPETSRRGPTPDPATVPFRRWAFRLVEAFADGVLARVQDSATEVKDGGAGRSPSG